MSTSPDTEGPALAAARVKDTFWPATTLSGTVTKATERPVCPTTTTDFFTELFRGFGSLPDVSGLTVAEKSSVLVMSVSKATRSFDIEICRFWPDGTSTPVQWTIRVAGKNVQTEPVGPMGTIGLGVNGSSTSTTAPKASVGPAFAI